MAIPTNANKIVSSKSNTYFKANKITIGTAVPTTGTYAKGDIIISSSPNASAIGWICTTAGTPGSWKAIKSGVDVTSIAWNSVSSKPSTFTPTLGVTSSTAFRGDYGNTAYQHSQSDHAPANAQKNSDITKAEIEAKLIGTITSHNHDSLYYRKTEIDNTFNKYAPTNHNHDDRYYTKTQIDAKIYVESGKKVWVQTKDPGAVGAGSIWIKTI